jgi:hypothetical protein
MENLIIDEMLQNYYTKIICIINLTVAIIALPVASSILFSAKSILKTNKTTSLRLILVVISLDVISCLAFITLSISVLIKIDFLTTYPIACKISYFFYDVSILLSLWFLALISLERYLHIVLEVYIPIIIWYIIMGVLLSLITSIGIYTIYINKLEVMPLATYCFLSTTDTPGHVNLMIISIINWISVIIVLFSYVSILILTLKTKLLTKSRNSSQLRRFHKQLNIALLKVVLILSFYLLTNSYETYLELWSTITRMDRSQTEDFLATALQNFNPLINCILLLLINKDISDTLVNWAIQVKDSSNIQY